MNTTPKLYQQIRAQLAKPRRVVIGEPDVLRGKIDHILALAAVECSGHDEPDALYKKVEESQGYAIQARLHLIEMFRGKRVFAPTGLSPSASAEYVNGIGPLEFTGNALFPSELLRRKNKIIRRFSVRVSSAIFERVFPFVMPASILDVETEPYSPDGASVRGRCVCLKEIDRREENAPVGFVFVAMIAGKDGKELPRNKRCALYALFGCPWCNSTGVINSLELHDRSFAVSQEFADQEIANRQRIADAWEGGEPYPPMIEMGAMASGEMRARELATQPAMATITTDANGESAIDLAGTWPWLNQHPAGHVVRIERQGRQLVAQVVGHDGSMHAIPVTGGEELLDYETRLLEPREGPHDPQPPTNRKQRRGQRKQSRGRR